MYPSKIKENKGIIKQKKNKKMKEFIDNTPVFQEILNKVL